MSQQKPPFRNPPEPPPMRIGQCGDTIDRQGVRRKADGSLRIVCEETIVNWLVLLIVGVAIGAVIMMAIR